MSFDTLVFVGGQLLAILVFSSVGLVAVGYRRRALQREMMGAGAMSLSLEAYLRFAAARVRILLAARRVNTIIFLIALICIIFTIAIITVINSDTSNSVNIATPFVLYVLIALVLFIGLYVGAYVHDIVGAVLVDAEALRVAQMSTLQHDDIVALKVRTVLYKLLPLLLYFEMLGTIILFGSNAYVSLLLLLLVAAIVIGVAAVFALPIYTATASLQPIEQTQWAALAPRIAAWAHLAGVEFASVQVQQDLVGMVNIRSLGVRRPTLIISETLLRYTEWRQQDALIAIALGVVRKHLYRNNLLRSFFLLAAAAVFIIALSFILSLSVASFTWIFLVLILYLLLLGVRIGSRRFLQTSYFGVDRIAALLTGDPLAVMVALHTINTLNGMPAMQGSVLVPAVGRRLLKLDELVRQPWQRAPQAAALVPACAPMSFGPYYLTVSLDQATKPDPVPSVPYANLG